MFATMLILKTAPTKMKSLRLHHVPRIVYQAGDDANRTSRFCVWNVAARLEHFGQNWTNFDLSINNSHFLDRSSQRRWSRQMVFWAEMLESLSNLTSLRLHDARERYEPREEENLDLNMLFKMLRMESVETLHLSGWAVTPEIMTELLPASFPDLRDLDMELLDMRSGEEDAWVSVLKMIVKRFGGMVFGPLVGLKHRPLEGKKDLGYQKNRAKKQATVEAQVRGVLSELSDQQNDEEGVRVQ